MIEEGILTACSNHLAVLLHLVMSANFSEETSWSNVFRNGLAGFQVQSQKQKNREAVPNVVIVKPYIDDEHPTTNALQARNAVVRQPYCQEQRVR